MPRTQFAYAVPHDPVYDPKGWPDMHVGKTQGKMNWIDSTGEEMNSLMEN